MKLPIRSGLLASVTLLTTTMLVTGCAANDIPTVVPLATNTAIAIVATAVPNSNKVVAATLAPTWTETPTSTPRPTSTKFPTFTPTVPPTETARPTLFSGEIGVLGDKNTMTVAIDQTKLSSALESLRSKPENDRVINAIKRILITPRGVTVTLVFNDFTADGILADIPFSLRISRKDIVIDYGTIQTDGTKQVGIDQSKVARAIIDTAVRQSIADAFLYNASKLQVTYYEPQQILIEPTRLLIVARIEYIPPTAVDAVPAIEVTSLPSETLDPSFTPATATPVVATKEVQPKGTATPVPTETSTPTTASNS